MGSADRRTRHRPCIRADQRRAGVRTSVRRAPDPWPRRCQGRLRKRRLPHPVAQPARAARGQAGSHPVGAGAAPWPAAGTGAGRQSADAGKDRARAQAVLRPPPVDQRHPLLRHLPHPRAGLHQQRAAHAGGCRRTRGAAQLSDPVQRGLPGASVSGRAGIQPREPGLAANDRPQRDGGAVHRLRDQENPAHGGLRRSVRTCVRRPGAGRPDHRAGAGQPISARCSPPTRPSTAGASAAGRTRSTSPSSEGSLSSPARRSASSATASRKTMRCSSTISSTTRGTATRHR